MSAARRRWLWWLVLILGLAFALRAFRLDAVPLRGDEGFTVRYWAADPRNLVHDVRRQEPHPVGTFVAFWAWKQTAGDTELAMRYLPLLGNLIGVAAMAGLGRRLLHSERAGLIAAALWAINPHLIWHAQDVRNYAIWAGLSALALWLFVRAADRNRPRDWLLYAAAETLALYTFFLEAFFVAGQALYLLLARRDRRVLRAAVAAWALVGILLIPLFVQVYFFTQTGYRGAVGDADPVALLTEFLPTLLIGDVPPAPWDAALPLAWIALVAVAWTLRKPPRPRVGAWLALSVLIPAGLLLIAAGRMSVFHPRYILAATPALPFDGPRCLASGGKCAAPARDGRVDDIQRWIREAAEGFAGVRIIDMNDLVCPGGECRAEREGRVVYRDSQHLTATFVASLSDALASRLDLPRGGRDGVPPLVQAE